MKFPAATHRYLSAVDDLVIVPAWPVRFVRSWAGAFFLGFFSCGIVAGFLAGALHWPN